ncbi:ATP-dependent DNA helicase RecG [uncultured Alistipes sp.]|jgi:ATP-dependent DNA helicase RecG|uniref:ATP-dependent DNA helicase RecG n=1 Tax=uncultured Alistipes sp. TaxID=538949 RepID=UPI002630A297|nr:ATP-dependent DNA helicase RecG [uncultured Alistipes sp.]
MERILDNEVKFVAGVGEARAKLLERELGIRTVGDLLSHYPFRYIDRTKTYRIGEITEEISLVQFRARVTGTAYAGAGRKRRFTVFVSDPTGSAELVWFQGIKWIEKRIETGREYLVFGRPSFFRGELSLVHPEVETMEQALSRKAESTMQGIYSTTEKLSGVLGTKGFHRIVCNAWELVRNRLGEPLPEALRQRYGLVTLHEALHNIHFPQSPEALRQAQYRLKFDELLGIQLNIQSRRSARMARNNGFLFPKVGGVFRTFYDEKLPFPLTEAQKRVIREIRRDTVTGYQMNRLLQGDVGSGKTLVALMSMLLAVDNGFQACMMAPTEILARQHYATVCRMLDGMEVRTAVLTGASNARERRAALEGIADGSIDLLIGTHALLEDRVRFANLGFVVIDEQHRFGVEQRARLWTKNEQPPHILVMTATPIPRTLAMTLYGDLDVSVIDELPPGRRPVRTVHYTDAARMRLFGFMKQEIRKGRQVYVVYPLIKESEAMDYKDLTDGYEAISRDFPLPEFVTTVCHGKMKPADKEESMRQFKSGEAHIMVATSVIEVGVDVPNATVMVIESAERFGLSQLHQLRGRVGRGGEQSYCILMSGEKLSRESRARLDAMCQTGDGFRLAELDLKLRGAGDINGTLQSGMALDLKIANPTLDTQLLTLTRDAAEELLARDRTLALPEHAGLRELKQRYAGGAERDFSMIS